MAFADATIRTVRRNLEALFGPGPSTAQTQQPSGTEAASEGAPAPELIGAAMTASDDLPRVAAAEFPRCRAAYPDADPARASDGDRPEPGGCSRRSTKRTPGPALRGGMVLIERAVHHRGSDLEHQMRSPRRPAHLLLRAHPTVQQPLHRTLCGRCRYWFVASPGRRIVDDQLGLPGHVCLEVTRHRATLPAAAATGDAVSAVASSITKVSTNEIERPLDLAVPEAPTDVLDGVGEPGAFLTIAVRGVRPCP